MTAAEGPPSVKSESARAGEGGRSRAESGARQLQAVGRLRPMRRFPSSRGSDGQLVGVHFREGQDVKKGTCSSRSIRALTKQP